MVVQCVKSETANKVDFPEAFVDSLGRHSLAGKGFGAISALVGMAQTATGVRDILNPALYPLPASHISAATLNALTSSSHLIESLKPTVLQIGSQTPMYAATLPTLPIKVVDGVSYVSQISPDAFPTLKSGLVLITAGIIIIGLSEKARIDMANRKELAKSLTEGKRE
ncbi:Uncharacterised protein [uncultured archaeon]|nr:Uncharacterised protein [uncultured archaeon]